MYRCILHFFLHFFFAFLHHSKWMCFICLGDFPLSHKARCPHHHHIYWAVTSALFCIRHASISNPLSHSHPFPLLCLNPHTCTHSLHTHTRTHTSLSPPLDHVGETVALNLSSSSPHQFVITNNPQHTPPSYPLPLHAGIPLVTVVWWCLPSNQKALTPSYMAYGIEGGGCRLC